MGMSWPWMQKLRHPTPIRWFSLRWLASLEHDPPPAAHGEQLHVDSPAINRDSASQFEVFFLRYDRQITSYLWRITGNEQIASELAQETFLRAWQHFATVCHYDEPLSWLFRVATNLARQHSRRMTAPVGRALPLDTDTDLPGGDPTQHVAEQELVRQTLMNLPIQQRSALILREVYGLSCAEVGNLLNISRDAVKMALWRAREQFRVRYLRAEEDE